MTDPIDRVNALGAQWSPDFDAYAAGTLEAHQIRCVLCGLAPCACPPFGTPEYLKLMEDRCGPAGRARTATEAIRQDRAT